MNRTITSTLVAVALLCAAVAARAQTNDLKSAADRLVISAAKPLATGDAPLRRAVAARCREMLAAAAGAFGAHPSAEVFPGPVAAGAPRVTKTLTIRHEPPSEQMRRLIKPLDYSSPFEATMYSTALYAAPSEVIAVEVAEALAGKVSVQIGCHTDVLDQWVARKEAWRRMPVITNHRKIESRRVEISNPFGGLIYITCPPETRAWEGSVTLSNAVMAPQFVMGKTTDEEWQKMIATSGAPWGEMGTDNIILTLPTSVLKKINDPGRRMKIWDDVLGAIMDLAQLPMPFYRAQRLVTDVHIGGGFMHSGYPIMVHHCPEKNMSTEEFISNPEQFSRPANGGPNWGFFHEIGHNMQNLDWVFDGTTEVSVNFFSLYSFDKIVGGRDAAHDGVSNEFTRRALKSFFSKPADFNKWKSDPFLGLLTFRMIQNDFGWELFKRTFRRYHVLTDAERPKTDAQKRDRLVTYLSEEAGRNFAPYFSAWGIPLSEDVKNNLKKFPDWMPYRFPPANK